jgi:hypothetical protein
MAPVETALPHRSPQSSAQCYSCPSFAGCGTLLFLSGRCCPDFPLYLGMTGSTKENQRATLGRLPLRTMPLATLFVRRAVHISLSAEIN